MIFYCIFCVQFFGWNNEWYDENLDTYYFHINFKIIMFIIHLYIHFCRAWVGFDKIQPLSESQAINGKFYNKNVKFTRAVDELNVSLNAIKARRPIHPRSNDTEPIPERRRTIEPNHQTQSVAQSSHATSSVANTAHESLHTGPVVLLDRLTKERIEKALNGDWSNRNVTRDKIVPKIYNLRRR